MAQIKLEVMTVTTRSYTSNKNIKVIYVQMLGVDRTDVDPLQQMVTFEFEGEDEFKRLGLNCDHGSEDAVRQAAQVYKNKTITVAALKFGEARKGEVSCKASLRSAVPTVAGVGSKPS